MEQEICSGKERTETWNFETEMEGAWKTKGRHRKDNIRKEENRKVVFSQQKGLNLGRGRTDFRNRKEWTLRNRKDGFLRQYE